jgi:hypothetical protein
MSSHIFDAGDKMRLDREEQLTQQAPRVLPDPSPSIMSTPEEVVEEPDQTDTLLDAVLAALKRRL